MYSSVFVINYESSTNSVISSAAVCVYCGFCLLYMFWFTVKAVSVYFGESVKDGCIASVVTCFFNHRMQVLGQYCKCDLVGSVHQVTLSNLFSNRLYVVSPNFFMCMSSGSMFRIISKLI